MNSLTINIIFVALILIGLSVMIYGNFKYDEDPDDLVVSYLDNLKSYDTTLHNVTLTRHSGKVLIVSIGDYRSWVNVEAPSIGESVFNRSIYSGITLSRSTHKRLNDLVAPDIDALNDAKKKDRKEALESAR